MLYSRLGARGRARRTVTCRSKRRLSRRGWMMQAPRPPPTCGRPSRRRPAPRSTPCAASPSAPTPRRALLLDLHGAVLEQQGLAAVLEAQSVVVRQRSGLQVEVRIVEAAGREREGSPGRTRRRSLASCRRPWPTWSSTPAPPALPSPSYGMRRCASASRTMASALARRRRRSHSVRRACTRGSPR